MNKHCQIRRTSSYSSLFPLTSVVRFGQKEVKYISVCQVDRFFEQVQNRTPEGWLDTSPISASTPSAQEHVLPVDAKKYSSEMSSADLFDTTVSKHCQTLAEVSAVASSIHRPDESEFVDDVVEPVAPPAPAPATE